MNDESKGPEESREKLAEGTLISHLLELRNRLMRALIAVIIVLIPCAYKANWLFEVVSAPIRRRLPPGEHLIATGVMAPFMTPFTLSIYVALFIAMPYVLYQVWAFVAPGLYRHEKRFAIPLLGSSIVLFYCGMAFAYYVVFPIVFRFFVVTTPLGVTWNADITNYVGFVMKVFLAFGTAFETPVAVVLLVMTGLVKLEKLQSNRGYVVIAVTVIAGIVTPSDALSMSIMAGSMYLLYEVGLFFAKMALKMQRQREQQQEAAVKGA